MEKVCLLHHVRSDEAYGGNAKLIDVYRSLEGVAATARRIPVQPASEITSRVSKRTPALDQDDWCEGAGIKEWSLAPSPGWYGRRFHI